MLFHVTNQPFTISVKLSSYHVEWIVKSTPSVLIHDLLLCQEFVIPQDSNHGIGTKGLSRFEAEIEGIMGNNYIYTCIEEIRRECYIPIFPIIMKLFPIDVTHDDYTSTHDLSCLTLRWVIPLLVEILYMADKTVLVDDLTSLVGQTKHLSGVQNPVYWLIRIHREIHRWSSTSANILWILLSP